MQAIKNSNAQLSPNHIIAEIMFCELYQRDYWNIQLRDLYNMKVKALLRTLN